MQDFGSSPAALRLLTSASNVALANPEQQVFDAMMDGWRNQQLSRGLREQTIQNRVATVARFREFADKPPWKWTVADVDEFTREATDRRLALSTLRHHHGAIRGFCDYLTNPLYDWMEICEREFGEIPSQVCLPWNTVAHRFEFEGDGKRRPFTYDELERLFDTADARVELLVSSGRKGALGALRDAQLLKTVYAFGLRRTEVVMLDAVDLHHNAKMRQWGRYGAIHVRWAKAAGGGAPRRRTVLLVPEFDWWVPGMQQWLEQARERFAPGDDLDALWVTERRTRLSAGYLDRRFAELRDEAGLSKDLTLHSLPAFLRHAPARVRLRRAIRAGAGRAHARVDDVDLRLRQFGLQEPGACRGIEGPHRRRSGMTVELETGWNLRSVMASRGIFQTSKLRPLLEERGIGLSREQVYRLVTQPPQRVRLDVLAALCDALECSLDDLVTITRREAAAPIAVGEEATRGSIGDLRPVRATIRRPRTK